MDDSAEANKVPNRANIVFEMEKLVGNANRGDSLFLYYTGHGIQLKSKRHTEDDNLDEAIVPCDHHGAPVDETGRPLNPDKLKNDSERKKVGGVIRDNDLHTILIDRLPEGVKLTTSLTIIATPFGFRGPSNIMVFVGVDSFLVGPRDPNLENVDPSRGRSSKSSDSENPFGPNVPRYDSPERITGLACGPDTKCSEDPSEMKHQGGNVYCLSFSLDAQTAYQTNHGETMTSILLDILEKEYGKLTYKGVALKVGHEMYTKLIGLGKYWTKVQNNPKLKSKFRNYAIPFQTPQWGAMRPLNLNETFTLD
ncbi:hypothetical protein NLI96_g1120 [Meripilus lineatus]|uniref:Peptidase C14 caspase domain-containing protein n=1 Tax=Meripilus lineatus TaxID=2056292 RepID=A0AAD5YN81_9APHY|nr:hypothetical protein NLI96_g1120 [Physisporinus lineatus]